MKITIQNYLESKNVGYTESGKNTTEGWINIACPFCFDNSNHCGIHLDFLGFSCWKCGEKGHISKLISKIEEIPLSKAKEISSNFIGISKNYKKTNTNIQKINIPDEITKKPLPCHTKYLENRSYDPEFLIKKYGIMFGTTFGKYAYRIILPYFFKYEMISFSSRSINDTKIKYLHNPISNSIIDIKNTLYNIDTVKNSAIVVEGVFDVFRIGDGCVSLSGTKYTQKQLKLLNEIERVMILFDSDAYKLGMNLAKQLYKPKTIEVVELEKGIDPDTLSMDDIFELRKFL